AQVFAERMAAEKARAALHRLEHEQAELRDGWVVAADTVVIVDGDTLSKPADDDDARTQIRRLSGRAHDVVTAVAITRVGGPFEVFSERTTVHFRVLTDAEIDAYVATGEGRDKCGAYGIQGLGAGLITRVHGCYFNVVGLPLSLTLERLVALGALTSWP
ncbi:MAG: septum formation protein Maf, partial [Deltaproteobacteria bacterium]|nr:septum formation protein Maf [Deltaproteobacteria bacterium]